MHLLHRSSVFGASGDKHKKAALRRVGQWPAGPPARRARGVGRWCRRWQANTAELRGGVDAWAESGDARWSRSAAAGTRKALLVRSSSWSKVHGGVGRRGCGGGGSRFGGGEREGTGIDDGGARLR